MKDVALFDELKAPVASADASPVDDSADDDDEDDIEMEDNFLSINGDGNVSSLIKIVVYGFLVCNFPLRGKFSLRI